MLALLALMISAPPEAPAAPSATLARFVGEASKQGLVAVDGEQDFKLSWCKGGKPVASVPIQKGERSPQESQVLRLRDTRCESAAFRLTVIEWTYETEDAAIRALEGHDDSLPRWKSAHVIWREGARVLVAESGAFMHWPRLRAIVEALGIAAKHG